jgi:hypothetical protein
MARSKEELAKALEALASGEVDAHHEEQQHEQPAVSPRARQLPQAVHVSRTIRPLPGKPGVPMAQNRASPPAKRSIFVRQTVIPPLLTLGVLMPTAGAASLAMGEESPLAEHPLIAVLLILMGLLILGAAILNMLHVKRLLLASSKH